jgi:hypothetical protein
MMTSDLLTTVLSIVENKLEDRGEKSKVKKKVFNILVECIQNLYHHIDEDVKNSASLKDNSVFFMISKHQEDYVIMTGNYMETNNVEALQSKLDLVNSLDKIELKTYYKEILSNGTRSNKGTAGLGLIDIARKSGQKLGYDFRAVDEWLTFFSLIVKVAE